MLIKVLFSAVTLTVLFNFLVFDLNPGIGLSLFLVISNLYFFVLRSGTKENTQRGLVASGVSIIFALLFAVRANGAVQIVNILSAVFTLGIAGYFYKSETNFSYTEKIILFPLILLGRSLTAFGQVFKLGQSTFQHSEEKNLVKPIMRGLAGAVPIIFILVLVLGAADPIFEKLVSDAFSNLGERTVASIVVFVAALLAAFARIHKQFSAPETFKVPSNNTVELTVIAGAVAVVFAIFMSIQVQYLFSSVGERELSSLGISSETYSEYVRKGFFELLVAASIASTVILLILRYLRAVSFAVTTKVLQWTGAILTIETMLLLFSAGKRLALYAEAHGLTRARIFGIVFLAWIAMILVFFLIRLFNKIKLREFFISISAVTVLALFSISIWNIDRLIAEEFQPTVNGEKDYSYIARLSPDAVDGWAEAVEDAERTIVELENEPELSAEHNRRLYYVSSTLRYISYDIENLKSEKKWQEKNLSMERALKRVEKNSAVFDTYQNLMDRNTALLQRVSEEEQRRTQLDRSDTAPLSE